MIEAHLYLDKNTFLKAISVEHRPNDIRICSESGYIPSLNNMQTTVNLMIGVYRLHEPMDYPILNRWKYLFSHFESGAEPIPDDSFDVGFMEPTEDVNLDKLTVKLRDNKKLSGLLKRYYRR